MATLWRLLPVTTLTVRQFTGGRTAKLALALSLFPALFAAIYVLRPWGVTPSGFLGDLFRELFLPTLLPIVVLLPATAAFGDELEDGTLPYLLMKPVTRIRLVLGKYLAAMLVTLPALLLGLVVTTLLASRGQDWESLSVQLRGHGGRLDDGGVVARRRFLARQPVRAASVTRGDNLRLRLGKPPGAISSRCTSDFQPRTGAPGVRRPLARQS